MSENKKFICPIATCNYSTNIKCNLELHNNSVKHKNNVAGIVTEKKKKECKCVCGYTTNDKSNLNKHKLSDRHKNFVAGIVKSKNKKCTICDYETTDRANYAKHLKIHIKNEESAKNDNTIAVPEKESSEQQQAKISLIIQKRNKLIKLTSGLQGTIDRYKGRYEKAPSRITREELNVYHQEWKDAEKKLAKLSSKLAKYNKILKKNRQIESQTIELQPIESTKVPKKQEIVEVQPMPVIKTIGDNKDLKFHQLEVKKIKDKISQLRDEYICNPTEKLRDEMIELEREMKKVNNIIIGLLGW